MVEYCSPLQSFSQLEGFQDSPIRKVHLSSPKVSVLVGSNSGSAKRPYESAPIAANFILGREESYLWANFRPYGYQKSSPLAAHERLPIKNHHLSECRLTPTYQKESPFAGESGQPIKKVHLSRPLRGQGG